jgi:hypothetical protein
MMKETLVEEFLKLKKFHLHHEFYLSFTIFKIFVLMCREKTNISSQIDLVYKQSLEERLTESTGTENRQKHTRLSQSNMRHVVLKAVTMKITVLWNTSHCRLLFAYRLEFYFEALF